MACPACGRALGNAQAGDAACAQCGRRYRSEANRVAWLPSDLGTGPRTRRVREPLARAANPLTTPLLPFRHWAAWQVNRYYARLPDNQRAADAWNRHYLDGPDLPEAATVLDHGCGRERHVAILNQLGFRTVGQDVAAHDWWGCLRSSGFQSTRADERRVLWRSAAFDLVVDFNVLNYLAEPAVASLASEIGRVVRSAGWWLLAEPNDRAFGSHAFQYPRVHALDFVRQCATDAGFVVERTSYESFYAPLFPLAVNYVRQFLTTRRFTL